MNISPKKKPFVSLIAGWFDFILIAVLALNKLLPCIGKFQQLLLLFLLCLLIKLLLLNKSLSLRDDHHHHNHT